MKREIVVGARLFFVPNRRQGHGEPRWITVDKVGRKWATCGGGWNPMRVNIETLGVDGGNYSSPGRCYLSEATYREEAERDRLWNEIQRLVRYGRSPERLTLSVLQSLHAALAGEAPGGAEEGA